MRAQLALMRHGDGRLGCFNGSSEGDAQWLADLLEGEPAEAAAAFAPDWGYARLAAGPSCVLFDAGGPPPGDFRRVFEHVLAHQSGAVYVGLSRPLSGTLQAAETAARAQPKPPACLDSGHVSAGQALLAWRAGELADAGAGAAEILAELARLKPLTTTWAMARDISHAVRGGRIPRWAGPVVRWSGLLPIAKVRGDGTLGVAGGLLARGRAPEAFARYVARRAPVASGWGSSRRRAAVHSPPMQPGGRLARSQKRRRAASARTATSQRDSLRQRRGEASVRQSDRRRRVPSARRAGHTRRGCRATAPRRP
jgi:hypothetical protein